MSTEAVELRTMTIAKKKGVETGEQAAMEACASFEATQKENAEVDSFWTSNVFALPPNLV